MREQLLSQDPERRALGSPDTAEETGVENKGYRRKRQNRFLIKEKLNDVDAGWRYAETTSFGKLLSLTGS